jgi:hypothetical protein
MDFDRNFKTPQIDLPRDRIFKVGGGAEILFPTATYTPLPIDYRNPAWAEDEEAHYRQWMADEWEKVARRPDHRRPGKRAKYVLDELRKIYPDGLPPRAALELKLRNPKNPRQFLLPRRPEVTFGVTTLKDAIKLARS